MKKSIYWLLLLLLYSCNPSSIEANNGNGERSENGNEIIFDDIDDKNFINMYYRDTLSLSKLIGSNGDYNIKSDVFQNIGDRLFISNPDKLNKTEIALAINNNKRELVKTIHIKVRSWIKNKYCLKQYDVLPAQSFYIYTHNKITYEFREGKLYKNTGNSKNLITSFKLDDPMYNQMVVLDDYYAVRTGTKIYVSRDLKNWKLIYDKKRGIKESLVLIKNSRGYELLFSEYTPGLDFSRHYIRRYNFGTNKIEDLKMFFATGEPNMPRARHTHLIVKDPYSKMIFFGNGDGDDESSIYFSDNDGDSFKRLGWGSQMWRTLTIFFTPTSIFWGTDCAKPQSINAIHRSAIKEQVSQSQIKKYPLINGALWCTEKIEDLDGYILSSNNEGGLYDKKNRVYFIKIIDDKPIAYEVFAQEGSLYAQLFPIGQDNKGFIYFKNTITGEIKKCKVIQKS